MIAFTQFTPSIAALTIPPAYPAPSAQGYKFFNNKMRGYVSNDAIIVGVESRTSSPVRIPRDKETLMHSEVNGLFPCAEGAGYAGGIVSAAIDGERVADSIVRYRNNQ